MINVYGDENPRVVLINSPLEKYGLGRDPESVFHPPLGLTSIASYLGEKGIPSAIIDAENDKLPIERIWEMLHELRPEFVGVNLFTPNMAITRELVAGLDTASQLLLGGPHASAMPDLTIRDEVFSRGILVMGEAEKKVHALVSGVNIKDIDGISYNRGGEVVHQSDNPKWLIDDLDDLELNNRYVPHYPLRDSSGNTRGFILSSRGCPYSCTFCAGGKSIAYNGKVRLRTPSSVVNEILNLSQEGVNDVKFEDDLALITEERTRQIFKPLIAEGLTRENGFNWRANGRANIISKLSDECLDMMAESGCRKIMFGVERGSDEAMRKVSKQITTMQVEESVRRLASRHIQMVTYFMIGFPDETESEMQDTVNFAHHLHDLGNGLLKVVAYKLRPYPGTPIWNDLLRQGKTEEELLAYLHEDIGDSDAIGRGKTDLVLGTQLSRVPLNTELEYLANLRSLGDQLRRPNLEGRYSLGNGGRK